MKAARKTISELKPLGELVHEKLREAIIVGDLKPNQRLMEVKLAESLGVSRTPVREAIKKLSQENLVEMIPRKGAYVKPMSKRDILEILEIRRVLESFAAAKAAQVITAAEIEKMQTLMKDFDSSLENSDKRALARADDAFHEVIYTAANNDKLSLIVKSLHESLFRFRTIYYAVTEDHEQVVKAHQKILDAIINKNSDLAKECTEEHIDAITQNVIEWLDSGKNDILTR